MKSVMKKLNKPEILKDSNNQRYYPDHMNRYMHPNQESQNNGKKLSVDRKYSRDELEALENEYNSRRR